MLIENKIKADGLDPMDVKGKIGLRSGRMLAFITPTTECPAGDIVDSLDRGHS
jgi:hypothetical protein